MIIFAYKQTHNQTNTQRIKSNSKTEATLILCGSLGERANSVSRMYREYDSLYLEYYAVYIDYYVFYSEFYIVCIWY